MDFKWQIPVKEIMGRFEFKALSCGIALLFVSCSTPQKSAIQMSVLKPISVSSRTTFLVFRNGKKSEEASKDRSLLKSPFCAFENLQGKNLGLNKNWQITVEPQSLRAGETTDERFALIRNRDYSFFCDFSEKEGFQKGQIVEPLNETMKGWASFNRVPIPNSR